MTENEVPIPPSKMIFDLPSYCYDMHTRVGLQVLQQLVRGVAGAEDVRDFFAEYKIKNAHRALGEVLFFVEGARIEGELVYDSLCSLEQRLFAHQFGLPLHKWEYLCFLVGKALLEGVLDRVREEMLQRYYGQEKLQFDCTRVRRVIRCYATNYPFCCIFAMDAAKNKQLNDLGQRRNSNIMLHFEEIQTPVVVAARNHARRTMIHLEPDEVLSLLRAAKAKGAREWSMILLAYKHGMRASEVCNLTMNDIDLKNGSIVVDGSRGHSAPRRL
jgi:hypothetical protein